MNRQKIRKITLFFAALIFPLIFYYFSPYIAIEATINKVICGSIIVFAGLFLISLVAGRVFCGWFCSAGGCQELIYLIRKKRMNKANYMKWIIWAIWVSTIVFFAIKNRGFEKIDFLYMTTNGLSIGSIESAVVYVFVLLFVIIPVYVFGRRTFCHSLCWISPFMIIGKKIRNLGRWSYFHLIAEKDKCIHCHICTWDCPMSLVVEDMVSSGNMKNMECILCGQCVDICPAKAIKFSFSKK